MSLKSQSEFSLVGQVLEPNKLRPWPLPVGQRPGASVLGNHGVTQTVGAELRIGAEQILVQAAGSADIPLLLLIAKLNHQDVTFLCTTEHDGGVADSHLVVQHPRAGPAMGGIGVDHSHVIAKIGRGVVEISGDITVGPSHNRPVSCTGCAKTPALQSIVSYRRYCKYSNYHKRENDPASTHDPPRGP